MFKLYVWKQDSFWWLSWNGADLGEDISNWPVIQDSYSSNLQIVLCERLTLSAASILATEGLFIHMFIHIFYIHISCYVKKIMKIGFTEMEKKFLKRFPSFSVKLLQSLAVPNGLRIEHFCDIIPKTQSWLVLNLPVFMFVYIHFNVPSTRITDLVRNVSDEKISYWDGAVTFVYVFAVINLVCVQSVTQLMNTPFITFVLS